MSGTTETENAVNVINWKIAGGGLYDGLMLGDSNTAIIGDFELEPWPKRHKQVLAAGLPGNGVVNVAYEQSTNNWIARLAPKFVVIYLGINDALFANQATWLTPAAWAASYQSIAQAAISAGAIAVCATYHMPGVSASGLISAAQLAAYNVQIRTTVHDALYYANPTKFIVVEVAGSLADPATGLTPDNLLVDGEHFTQNTIRQYVRRWIEDGLSAGAPY
jgi:GDSL-like Lipase/Acylhydrolase family